MEKGIYTWAVGKQNAEESFKCIKNAGFDTVMLDWSDDFPQQISKTQSALSAMKCDLKIENGHLSFNNINSLWEDNIDGEEKTLHLIDDIVLAGIYGISVLVIHPTSGNTPPPSSQIGLKRFGRLVEVALKNEIKLAFENIERPDYIVPLFERFTADEVGFCYDVGHRNCYTPQLNLLEQFGDRLLAIHLHDNHGVFDEHCYPFCGTIDWNDEMDKIRKCDYKGSLALEVEWNKEIPYSLYLQNCNKSLEKLIHMYS